MECSFGVYLSRPTSGLAWTKRPGITEYSDLISNSPTILDNATLFRRWTARNRLFSVTHQLLLW